MEISLNYFTESYPFPIHYFLTIFLTAEGTKSRHKGRGAGCENRAIAFIWPSMSYVVNQKDALLQLPLVQALPLTDTKKGRHPIAIGCGEESPMFGRAIIQL